MTDPIPAGLTREEAQTVREWAERARGAEVQDETVLHAARVLLAVLPKRPTLADMTTNERDDCTGMQADLAQGDRVVILDGTPDHDDRVQVLEPTLDVYRPRAVDVTPRPDLPLLTWPCGQKPAPAPIAPEDYPPRDQLALGAKWYDLAKLEEALRQKGEAADQAIVLDDEGDAHVWEARGGGRWMVRVPVQQCGPFRLILNEKGADQ